ncbi:MAG TPA: hypothetical protein VIA98_10985 [Allosphingosinicella sp.]|jgi:hypothetical protein
MIELGCMLARMGGFPLPAFLDHGAEVLKNVFWKESGQDIALSIDPSHLNPPLEPGVGDYAALDLHHAAWLVTHNPPPPQRSHRIAVLYANLYAPHHGVLGMMFDRGFATWDDPNDHPALTGSPREACAIFLQAVVNLRGPGPAAAQEALFTTIHEMGHLFNLQHTPSNIAPNFMATSLPTAPYPPPAYKFIPPHRAQLNHCSSSPYVWPGGAKFEDTGDWQGAAMKPSQGRSTFGAQLLISMARHEFWKFEPVELVVEVSIVPGVKQSVLVPDALDPGYEAFRIWLESPTGERRRYRSPRHYCSSPGRRRIAPGRSLKRDISIFGEAGGYTFRASGIWRIFAEFDVGDGSTLRSNSLEVFVKPRMNTEGYQRAAARMTARTSAALLYHRLVRPDLATGELLLCQLDDPCPTIPKGGIEYALGRALSCRTDKGGVSPLLEDGLELLRRARDRTDIGEVQRRHADEIVDGRGARSKVHRGKRHAMSW